MCGICGYTNQNQKITDKNVIEEMTSSLKLRGPDQKNTYIDGNVAFGHQRLSIIDLAMGNQPMIKDVDGKTYVIVYNGELYNTEELRNDLISKGHQFKSHCDTEVMLDAYIEYGSNCLKLFNGIFAFAIYDKNSDLIFLARDNLGIKPLFYSLVKAIDNTTTLVFGSEIKAILKYPDVEAKIDKQGIMELIGLGPAHTPGFTYFKDIFEIKAGHYAFFKNGKFEQYKYWDLTTAPCYDNEKLAAEHIRFLLEDATKRQLVSDVGICSMLSGGVDSSILSYIAQKYTKDLNTFSIDFYGNDKNFVANSYQVSRDSDYVKIMKEYLHSKHHTILFDDTILFKYLDDALIARDMPGMADIDSSMYAFCKSIHQNDFKVCLSGECSDEIFGGYPWYYKKHLTSYHSFPWALSENIRESIVASNLLKKDELKNYIKYRYDETLKNVEVIDINEKVDNKFRNINYLTIKWFMNTLVERTDRMSMANSLEVRVPYADYRIFDYVYNLPAKMKLGIHSESDTPIEKYILRKAFEGDIPNEVLFRKKSPFPKTYDPKYLKLVEDKLSKIMENKEAKLFEIVSKDYVQQILDTKGKNLTENWFGQLMTYPQTLAYLIQIERWFEIYNVKLDI